MSHKHVLLQYQGTPNNVTHVQLDGCRVPVDEVKKTLRENLKKMPELRYSIDGQRQKNTT